jgi:hypothetical protein
MGTYSKLSPIEIFRLKISNLFKKESNNSSFLEPPMLTKVKGYSGNPSFNETFLKNINKQKNILREKY